MIDGHRVVAVEEHIAPPTFVRTAHGLGVVPGDETETELTRAVERGEPLGSRLASIETRLGETDAAEQDMAVLSLNPPGVQPYHPAPATELAGTFNDSLAAIVRHHPDRFAGLGAVAPQAPTQAAEEIARIMGPLGLHGVMINSHTGGHYLDEPAFAPLLAAAEEYSAPIYLHPRVPSVRGPYLDHGLSGAIWGYQAEAGLHATRLILSGTLDRCPCLVVVLGHLGEGLPFWLRRIDDRRAFAARVPGAATAMPRLELTPSEYVRRNIVVTTSGIDDPAVLDLALRVLGDDHIMFAIDAPYEDAGGAVDLLRHAPVSEAQRTSIAHRTAERVFALSPSSRPASPGRVAGHQVPR